jgi:hypothetical protein
MPADQDPVADDEEPSGHQVTAAAAAGPRKALEGVPDDMPARVHAAGQSSRRVNLHRVRQQAFSTYRRQVRLAVRVGHPAGLTQITRFWTLNFD